MSKTNKKTLEEIIRVDHAGERGAIKIYEGQLLALKTFKQNEYLKRKIEEMNIQNIYISDLDFSSLHQKIRNFVFKKIFILFPDPWHRRRHFKRKLINQSFIKKIKLICDNNTSVVIATDNMIYQDIIRESFKKDKHFEKLVEKTNNRFLGIVDVVETKYYKKALKNNNESIFFVFNKK